MMVVVDFRAYKGWTRVHRQVRHASTLTGQLQEPSLNAYVIRGRLISLPTLSEFE